MKAMPALWRTAMDLAVSTDSATYSPGSTEMDVDGDTVSETDADGDRLGLETTERVPSTQKPALPQTPE